MNTDDRFALMFVGSLVAVSILILVIVAVIQL